MLIKNALEFLVHRRIVRKTLELNQTVEACVLQTTRIESEVIETKINDKAKDSRIEEKRMDYT